MAKKQETSFKEKVQKDLKTLPNIFAEKIQQVGIRGTPDLLLCIGGFFVAIELKIDGEKPDPLQEYKLGLIKKAGGISLTATPSNWDRVFESIRHLHDGGNFIYP
jgi:hypothetical protein